MMLKVLGCSGGIGGPRLHTTAFLLDRDILIDAGTGVTTLSHAELAAIDHVFLTHAHLDHIAALPLMIDTVFDSRQTPVTIHASSAVIDSLKKHIFNWTIWPDFSAIPSLEAAALRYNIIEPGQSVTLGDRKITALPVEHSVPAVGYHIDSGRSSLVYSGDMDGGIAFWESVNQIDNLQYLIIECAFPDRDEALAILSKHLSPALLARQLQNLTQSCAIYLTHLKPGQSELIIREVEANRASLDIGLLHHNQEIVF